MEKTVRKVTLHDQPSDASYWRDQPPRSGLPPSNRSDGNTTTGPMTLHPDFREFIQLLNDHSVRYLVVGGYAVALHGHPRYTKDLDVWAEADSENIERLLGALKAFGFGSLDLNVDDFLEPDTVVQLGRPAQRIDLLTELDGVAFDDSYATRQEIPIENVSVSFIGLEQLRKNKKASGRHQDLADLEHLREEE